MTRAIAGLSEIAERYAALLCDVWGVIHNGREAFAGPCAALARWRVERGPVVLVSNSPRPAADVVHQLDALGVPREAWSALVTSGDATRALIAERAPGPAWRIGPARDAPLYEGLGLAIAPIGAASFILCTGPDDDEAETPEDYRGRFAEAAGRGLTMVCANPDKIVQRGDKLIYCGGALAELYEAMGGTTEMAGKPFGPIYRLAMERLRQIAPGPVAMEEVLAVGDGVATDLKGANDFGIDALFVVKGIHGQSHVAADGQLDLAAVDRLLEREGARADWAMAELAW
ncbi:MAG: TIGR01459 family HAD-type hydrolase [Caulobacteraceae bacterium]